MPQSAPVLTFETLAVSLEGNIAHVALNRPEQLNAMNGDMFREIGEAFRALDAIPSVRAVVLSGNGKLFTAGLDLKESASLLGQAEGDPARVREKLRRHILFWQDCLSTLEECRAPVVACVHGACLGGGIDLITAADMRICTEDAYFTIQEVNVGIVADVGTLQRMPHLLPQGILRELAYTGRKFTSAEADKYGFVNSVHADKEAALAAATALAHAIAAKSPMAVTGTKAIINHSRDHSLRDGLEYVAAWNSGQLLGEDVVKAATAALTRQEVTFADLLAADD
ncbi:crotonase/enoyl-CoA hydratase family protein [Kordiimonas pumila]|uniref:Crotonase/enoyl-CoA hydratase family protein n=1 Tax=Kordiimonas pumila TaxID=2161677 RepID=A0ABV7D0G9_9PROT|nr:crotonase/enoyl-CoA hydratase family protein [Kordiimonas pumila]